MTLPSERSAPSARVSFEEFFLTEKDGLIMFVMHLGAGFSSAQDIVQDIFIKSYPLWDTIDSPRAYLRRMAYLDFHKRRVLALRSIPVPELGEQTGLQAPDVATRVEFDDLVQTVMAAVQRLPPLQRVIMALTIDDFEPREIAELLRIPGGRVRVNLFYARRRLRSVLKNLGGDDRG